MTEDEAARERIRKQHKLLKPTREFPDTCSKSLPERRDGESVDDMLNRLGLGEK